MDYMWYAIGVLIVIALVDCYNGWKLGSKISNKTEEQINTELKSLFGNLDEGIANIKTNLDNFKTTIENIQTTINEKIEDLKEIKAKIEEIVDTIKNFKEQLENIKDQFNGFKDAIDKQKSYEAQIVSLQEEVKTLKAKLPEENKEA